MEDIQLTDEEIKQIVQSVIDDYLKPKFYELGMNASGRWINSLQATVENGRGIIKGQFYTYYLANGRAGGNEPPLQPLIEWVGYKLGLFGEEAVSRAWAIKKKIGRVGTSWYQQGGTDLMEILESREVTDFIYSRVSGLLNVRMRSLILRRTREILNA